MPVPGTSQRSIFLDDARERLLRHHRDQVRMAALATALSGCLHYIAALNGVPCETPEPECSIDAKRLLGGTLG